MKLLRRFCQLVFSMAIVVMILSVTAFAADTTPHDFPVKPINLNDTSAGVYLAQLMFGQEVHARDGATYYESADLAGSGRQGTSNNIYTEKLYIAGFAQVDAEGNLVAYQCYLRDYIPTGDPAPDFVASCTSEWELFIATYTRGFTTGSVGWFSARDLDWTTGNLEYITAPEKDPYQDIYYYNPAPDEPPDGDYDYPDNGPDLDDHGGTIIGPVISLSEEVTPQDIADEAFDQVLLATDTLHNPGWLWFSTSSLNKRDNITAITILNPSDRENAHLLNYIEQQWNVTPTMIRLNPDGTTETEF